MRKKSLKENASEKDSLVKKEEPEQGDPADKSKKSTEEYQCGKEDCHKLYHSYTAFYNHCKKSHEGVFPADSLYNGKIFEGPSKNRGRPRIKKTDAKDSVQIQSLKTENELIQFLGTLNKKKKSEQLIIYVSNPLAQLREAVDIMSPWQGNFKDFTRSLTLLNEIISENDLPDFYDPIQINLYADKVDSYNFLSIYNFLMEESRVEKLNERVEYEGGFSLMRKVLIIWLTRILSSNLLAEVIYTIAQVDANVKNLKQMDYLSGKSFKLQALIEKYFQCLRTEQQNKNGEIKPENTPLSD